MVLQVDQDLLTILICTLFFFYLLFYIINVSYAYSEKGLRFKGGPSKLTGTGNGIAKPKHKKKTTKRHTGSYKTVYV